MLKIITDKDKIYNALDTTYKKLGVKYLALSGKHETLMEVHLKTLKALEILTGKYEEAQERIELLKGLRKE